jgi:hypothetical protein
VKAISVILLCALATGSYLCCDLISLMGMGPLEVGTTAPDFTLPSLEE